MRHGFGVSLTQVEHCPAGEIHVDHAMFRPKLLLHVLGKAQVGEDAANIPDIAVLHHAAELNAQGEEANPNRLHEEHPVLLCGLDEYARLFRVDRKGLLTQDVLLGFETQHGVLEVVRVRCRDIYDVDIGVLDKILVRSVGYWRTWDLAFLKELLGSFGGRGGSGGHHFMVDIRDTSCGGIKEEVFSEGWLREMLICKCAVVGSGMSYILWAMPPVAA